MKDLRSLKDEIILALGSFADNVKISLYEDKFYIVECTDCRGFIKCGNCLKRTSHWSVSVTVCIIVIMWNIMIDLDFLTHNCIILM